MFSIIIPHSARELCRVSLSEQKLNQSQALFRKSQYYLRTIGTLAKLNIHAGKIPRPDTYNEDKFSTSVRFSDK